MELAEWQLLAAFGLKARCGPALPDMNAFRARNLLTLQFVAAFWSRYLSELVNSGLLASPLSHRKALRQCIAALLPVSPANLYVLATDWAAEECFDTPAVAAISSCPSSRRSTRRCRRRARCAGCTGSTNDSRPG